MQDFIKRFIKKINHCVSLNNILQVNHLDSHKSYSRRITYT